MRFQRGIRSGFRAYCINFSRIAKREPPRSRAVRGQRVNCGQSVCSLFEEAMRINDRLCGFFSPQTIQQFHQACLVRITHGRFATWLDPVRVLNPKVVMNLLPQLRVSMDLMQRGRWLSERLTWLARRFVYFALSVSPPRSETNEFHKLLSLLG